MVTKRKKSSPDFESLQRKIAHRLQAKLPLAGMIAATTLLCGCQERAGRDRLDLMLTPEEWEAVKTSIRNLPDCKVPYTFCDEFYCRCRDYPKRWETLFGVNGSECAAGKDFGVIGPTGKFRKCLHTVEESEWRQPPLPHVHKARLP